MNRNEVVLDVQGMTCPSCVSHVNGALRRVEGVIEVDVRLRDGKVRVKFDSDRVELAALLEALEEEGYASAPSTPQ